MTPYFVETFKKEVKCTLCSDKTWGKSKSMCAKHLVIARLKFRAWSAMRRTEGLCLHCEAPGFKGQCRCLEHTVENQIKCRAWSLKTVDMRRERRYQRIAQGICGACGTQPLQAPTTICQRCRERLADWRRRRKAQGLRAD